jgi:predicted nucleic-acid-binding protein
MYDSKGEILDAISALLSAVDVSFEDEPSIEEALFVWRDSSAGFADCLIGARHRSFGCIEHPTVLLAADA